MNNKSSTFITWYFNDFRADDLYSEMVECIEGSKWHRERTVAVHTDMVVAEYISLASRDWSHNDLLGAIACAFHDVGKPPAKIEKHSEERGTYYSFGGHEMISSRLWESWAVKNFNMLHTKFGITVEDIYKVNWMIEHHRPWGLKKSSKRQNLYTTAMLTVGIDVFTRMLIADNWGRIGDTQDANRVAVNDWISDFVTNMKLDGSKWTTFSNIAQRKWEDYNQPVLYVLIGCSGSGKSTFSRQLIGHTFSWDNLRLEWYDANDYANAFQLSVDDKSFGSKANNHYIELLKDENSIIVDNVNTSSKRRRFFIDNARKQGYRIVAVTFPSMLTTVIDRQNTRTDKTIPAGAVEGQYMNTQMPQLGDFDEIIVHDGNL